MWFLIIVFIFHQCSFCSDEPNCEFESCYPIGRVKDNVNSLLDRGKLSLLRLASVNFCKNTIYTAESLFRFLSDGCDAFFKILKGLHRTATLADINENQGWYKKPIYFFASIGGGLGSIGSGAGWFLKNGMKIFSIYVVYKVGRWIFPVFKPCLKTIFLKEIPVVDVEKLVKSIQQCK